MPKIIEVIYENGVFKPLEKVELGERVRIKIENIDEILEKYCGLLESDLSIEDIERMRLEAKTWKA
ncbi:antitoxin [Archaeoglobales archaeon]|nr:MAG: antitoxin [Archaeoglobales archaeon]